MVEALGLDRWEERGRKEMQGGVGGFALDRGRAS